MFVERCMTAMKNLLLFALLGLSLSTTCAQGPAYLPGELLVMLRPGVSAHQLERDLVTVDGRTSGLRAVQELSAPMRTWLLRFDAAALAQDRVLARGAGPSGCATGAEQPPVKDARRCPTTVQYGQQWHHQNINSEAAWDITTGGLPPRAIPSWCASSRTPTCPIRT
jgi:hypothetical protein